MPVTIKIHELYLKLGLYSAAIASAVVDKKLKNSPYLALKDINDDGITNEDAKLAIEDLGANNVLRFVDAAGNDILPPDIDMETFDGLDIRDILITVCVRENLFGEASQDNRKKSREELGTQDFVVGEAVYRFVVKPAEDTEEFLCSISRLNFSHEETPSGDFSIVLTRCRDIFTDYRVATEVDAWKWWDEFTVARGFGGVIRDRVLDPDGWIYGLRIMVPSTDGVTAELVKFHETDAPDWNLVNSQDCDNDDAAFAWFEEQLDILWPATVEPPMVEETVLAEEGGNESPVDEDKVDEDKVDEPGEGPKREQVHEFDIEINGRPVSVTITKDDNELYFGHALWTDAGGAFQNASTTWSSSLKSAYSAKVKAKQWLDSLKELQP